MKGLQKSLNAPHQISHYISHGILKLPGLISRSRIPMNIDRSLKGVRNIRSGEEISLIWLKVKKLQNLFAVIWSHIGFS